MSATVAFKTLGCRLNQAESTEIAESFSRAGYSIVQFGKPSDVVVIHSCTVTATADSKSMQAVRSVRRRYPGAFIVLAGCAVESGAGMRERSGADLLAGQQDKFKLPEMVAAAGPAPALPAGGLLPPSSKSRAFLRIQTGCDFRCAYCIVPDVRGNPVSRPFEEVLSDARRMITHGFQELVITGVNTGIYSTPQGRLPELLQALTALPGLGRLRLSSVEPTTVETALVNLMASNKKICRYLHLPLQSGDDTILRSMRRHYSAAQFEDFIMNAARLLPGCGFGTDIITGFPGETDQAFDNTFSMVERLPFSNLHVFPYSPRPGTPAAECGIAPPAPAVRQARAARLIELGNQKRKTFAAGMAGKEIEVLVEKVRSGCGSGWIAEYLPAQIMCSAHERRRLLKARVTDCKADLLIVERD